MHTDVAPHLQHAACLGVSASALAGTPCCMVAMHWVHHDQVVHGSVRSGEAPFPHSPSQPRSPSQGHCAAPPPQALPCSAVLSALLCSRPAGSAGGDGGGCA